MKKLIEKIYNWYQSELPERWGGKTGLAGLFLFWVVILIFELYWLLSGVTDLYLLVGCPVFFGILTFVIMKWSLKLF